MASLNPGARPDGLDIPPGAGRQMMLIDGVRAAACAGGWIEVTDPCTGEAIGQVPDGAAGDIALAVDAAARSFETGVWRGLHPADRGKILWRAADLIERHAEELARLETLDSGMLLAMARGTVAGAANTFRYYAGWATKVHGATTEISSPAQQLHAFTLREPIGVCGFITPWNVPLALSAIKIAPALAVGCSYVHKPAEETPFTALRLAELLLEAGVPPGVANVVTGRGETAGAALTSHPKVAKVAFTGSTEVGRLIVQAAAGNLKKVTLELGGKSPVIVFDDCDLERTIMGAAMGVFVNSGQVCVAGSRLLVQRKSFDAVVEGVAAVARKLTLGNSFDPATQIGPIISRKQTDRVMDLIASGLGEGGGELVAGGVRHGESGCFVEPTVLARPRLDTRVVREEVFGPVVTAIPFDDMDEAIALANDTTYGLASAVWTRDFNKAHLAAKRLQAGKVWINCQFVSDPSQPGGGYKQSGWGRENGPEGLDAYLQTKSVIAALTGG